MLKLKNLVLKSNVIQSPMAGCTDLAFRLIARQHGMEFAFLEMVAADSLVRRHNKTFGLLKSAPEDRPLGAQLVGCNPDTMAEAAVIIEEMGFDLLDINMGCPVPKIVSPGGGSALLIEPEKAENIFKRIVKAVKRIPVTVKMRKGFSDPSGQEALRIAQTAEGAGLDAVTIHGRTRSQGYSGNADWDAIALVKKHLKIPVIGNGDVVDGQSAKKITETSGCDGVMIGRGALGNPWIYKELDAALNGGDAAHAPTLEEKRDALLRHMELELKTEGEFLGVLKMRKIACWYFKEMPGCADFRYSINRAQTATEIRDLIVNFKPLLN